MAGTDEDTVAAADDALYVLTAVLLTPAKFPSVLGDDYPEACAALGLPPLADALEMVRQAISGRVLRHHPRVVRTAPGPYAEAARWQAPPLGRRHQGPGLPGNSAITGRGPRTSPPADAHLPEIGDEPAAGRGLRNLAQKLLDIAERDIAATRPVSG